MYNVYKLFKIMRYIRANISKSMYAKLEAMCVGLTNSYVEDGDAEDIIIRLSKRINTKRRKKRYADLEYPEDIIFEGNNDSGMYHFDDVIQLSHNPSMYTIIHELAHRLHYLNAMPWEIKQLNKNGDFDWHGTEFMEYLYILRDIVRNQKIFQQYLKIPVDLSK